MAIQINHRLQTILQLVHNMKKFLQLKGFTLIELLVVIAIIGVITSVILVSMTGSRAKARDGKRISDVSQLQVALEQYFSRNNSFPVDLTTLVTQNYLSELPKDPITKNANNYITYVRSPDTFDYLLKVQLEKYYGEGIDTNGVQIYGYTCSVNNNEYCVRSN